MALRVLLRSTRGGTHCNCQFKLIWEQLEVLFDGYQLKNSCPVVAADHLEEAVTCKPMLGKAAKHAKLRETYRHAAPTP